MQRSILLGKSVCPGRAVLENTFWN